MACNGQSRRIIIRDQEKNLAQAQLAATSALPVSVTGFLSANTRIGQLLVQVCNLIYDEASEILPAVLLLSSDRKHLKLAAGPKIPQEWNRALENLDLFPDASFYSTGGPPGTTVWIADLRSNASFAACWALADTQGYRSAWTVPIFGNDRETLGALILFCRTAQHPVDEELKLIGRAAKVAAALIEQVDMEQPENGSSNLVPGEHPDGVRRAALGEIIGTSPGMESLFCLIEKVRNLDCPVLILGETGTGKDLIARSIHTSGFRDTKPYVVVDCSSLVPTLIEAELFGYQRGAFTGALRSKQGLMESANGGTVFLDEVGELPIEMQSRLLRVLQEKEVRPIGSRNYVRISVRVIASTNRNLEEAVRLGTFREDLFFRLNVVQIRVPSLRERLGDIPALVSSFITRFEGPNRKVLSISREAMACLVAYDWPGNVRELENTVQRAIVLGTDSILQLSDLPLNVRSGVSKGFLDEKDTLSVDASERRAILTATRLANGHVATMARMLRIGRSTVYRKLREYNVAR
jgi:transcriptional regulator with GAF, ATPase, and Fis domain